MFMKNEGLVDRILRAIFGIGFFILGFFYFESNWKYVSYFISLILLITAVTGYCGFYRLFEISTMKKKVTKKKFIRGKEETGM